MCALRLLADTFSFCHKTGLNTATAVSDILRQYQTSSWPLQSMSVIDVVRGGLFGWRSSAKIRRNCMCSTIAQVQDPMDRVQYTRRDCIARSKDVAGNGLDGQMAWFHSNRKLE